MSETNAVWIYITPNISKIGVAIDSKPVDSIFSMLNQPQPGYLAVPNQFHELTVKMTRTGVTVLAAGRFRKRYTGSKRAAVDINGNLYTKASELRKILAADNSQDIKKPRVNTQGKFFSMPEPPGFDESTTTDPIVNNPRVQREYVVNKKEVRARIEGMISAMKGKKELYFFTVTFPKTLTDDLAYQVFNTWLTKLRQKKMLHNYVWVAERQDGKRLEDQTQATNTIHFHVAVPHRMHVVTANKLMRESLIHLVKSNQFDCNIHLLKRYNGVDIAKNRKTKRVVNFAIKKGKRALITYLTKYVTKNDTKLNRLAWYSSRGFSALFTGVTCTRDEFFNAGFFNKIIFQPTFIRKMTNDQGIEIEMFRFYAWRDQPPKSFVKHLDDLNTIVLASLN